MMRQPVKTRRPHQQEIVDLLSRIAPVKGWNTRDSKASMELGYALYLDNWWPTPREVQLRKGATDWTTGITGFVKTLMTWNSTSGTSRLFGATDAGIFNCTASGAVGAAITAITNGKCQWVDYTTTGGSFLFVVNGTDSIRYYDGAAVTITALYPITGGGNLTTANIANISVFKRALFFIEKDSMSFFYFPIDTIAGTVSRYPLGALFSKGGYLMAHGTWTVDGGEGQDDYSAFVTSKGQVAIYKGTDPASAATWGLQGVYDLGEPIGRKCFQKYGGDLLLICRSGVFPLGKALQSATVNVKSAISDTINTAFNSAASLYGANYGWQVSILPEESLLLVNIPTTEFSAAQQYAMNTVTGAWARFTDWNAACFEVLNNQLYMGLNGKVAKAWYGLNDFNSIINCYAKPAFDYFRPRGRQKHMKLVRPILTIQGAVSVDLALDVDFEDGTTYGASSFAPSAVTDNFDTALWVADGGSGAVWVGDAVPTLDWETLDNRPFLCAAPRLRVRAKDATVAWAATDFVLEAGGIL